MVLVLYETALGFCLFKMVDEGRLNSDSLWKDFESPESAASLCVLFSILHILAADTLFDRAVSRLKLKALHRFNSTASAVEEMSAMSEGKLGKGLKQFLTDEVVGKGKGKETLAVVDPKLGASIAKKLSVKVISENSTLDLYRGIRSQLATLLEGLDQKDLDTMNLGLSHSLSRQVTIVMSTPQHGLLIHHTFRFKVKFSPDKVDTMIVQAIGLLDELDKEINIYSMRVKEWYGWHFPEMGKIIVDNLAYAKCVRAMGSSLPSLAPASVQKRLLFSGFRTNAATTSFAAILPEDLEATLKAAAEISMGTEIADTDINHINALCDQVISITEYRAQLYDYLRNRMHAIAPNLTALVGELSGPEAPAIGLAARAKLESRLRALEYRQDLNPAPGERNPQKAQKYALKGDFGVYNVAADSVAVKGGLLEAGRDPLGNAISAAQQVLEEKKSKKEVKKSKKSRKSAAADDDASEDDHDANQSSHVNPTEMKEVHDSDSDSDSEAATKAARKAAKKALKEAKKRSKSLSKTTSTPDGDVEMNGDMISHESSKEKKKDKKKRPRESVVTDNDPDAMDVDNDREKKKKKKKERKE
ncbi:Nucleolar protein 58 [Tulasnella sp. 403]|nr:Nucleolar protein 58 [Tulasnella sp. 403]